MPTPLFALTNYVFATRQYLRVGNPELVDVNMKKTVIGQITGMPPSTTDSLGNVTYQTGTFSGTMWSKTQGTIANVISGVFIYQVTIWDIEARAMVAYSYPESELVAYATPIAVPSKNYYVEDPARAIVNAVQHDGDRPPPDVAAIAAAVRASFNA